MADYSFGDLYGYDSDRIGDLLIEMNADFNGIFEADDLTFIGPIIRTDGDLDLPNLEKLVYWETEVQLIGELLRSDEYYQKALQAYHKGDYTKLAKLLSSVFNFPSGDKQVDNTGRFYHGVTPSLSRGIVHYDPVEVQDWISSDEYIDLCLKILQEGIRPTSGGMHAGALDGYINPVFCVKNSFEAHGLLVFEVNPSLGGYLVWQGNSCDGEYLIYAPRVKEGLQLSLKSAEMIQSRAGPENSYEAAMGDYRNKLEERLRERKVDFTLLKRGLMERGLHSAYHSGHNNEDSIK